MSQGIPFVLDPPIAAVLETEPVTFDFGNLLASNYASGVYITSVLEIIVTVAAGVDASPSSRLVGGPVITAGQSRTPPLANSAVVAWFGTMVGGVTYLLQCVVQLSDGMSKPSIEVKLPCYDPEAA